MRSVVRKNFLTVVVWWEETVEWGKQTQEALPPDLDLGLTAGL